MSHENDGVSIDHLIDIASGSAEDDPKLKEERGERRFPYHGLIAFVQTTATGGRSIATILQCENMGAHGLGVISRYMLHVGHEGAVLMQRANGERVILGATVAHCRYKGDMKHECGIKLTPVPAGFTIDDFRDEHGNLPNLSGKLAA